MKRAVVRPPFGERLLRTLDKPAIAVDMHFGKCFFELGKLVLDRCLEVRMLARPNLFDEILIAALHELESASNGALVKTARWHMVLLLSICPLSL
jgi:hypothetical protein